MLTFSSVGEDGGTDRYVSLQNIRETFLLGRQDNAGSPQVRDNSVWMLVKFVKTDYINNETFS